MFDSVERDVMTPGAKPPAAASAEARPYKPVFSILATIIVVIAAIWLGSLAWTRYDATPWTRDA
ncbi:MAG: hypothetical protein HIU90_16910 [Proteobacteria bacterium]|nr:hypothetical protein [Pseudomonadota bacterium]